MEGDTVERVGESLSLTVGDWYTVYIPSMSYGNICVKEVLGTMTYYPSFFKLIKRKEKEMNKRLERNQEYDVKLTGEEVAILYGVLGMCNGGFTSSVYYKLGALFSGDLALDLPIGMIGLNSYRSEIEGFLEEAFAPIETGDQRKLRELKEQYAKLGDIIAAMENISK